jgi:hypothetical protein
MFDARRSTMTIQHSPHERHLVLVVGDGVTEP